MDQSLKTGQYVLMAGRQYLHLNPATWTWHLTPVLQDLAIWDYHHDRECLTKPRLDGKRVRYVELTKEELAMMEEPAQQETLTKAA